MFAKVANYANDAGMSDFSSILSVALLLSFLQKKSYQIRRKERERKDSLDSACLFVGRNAYMSIGFGFLCLLSHAYRSTVVETVLFLRLYTTSHLKQSTNTQLAAVEKSLRLLQAFVQIAAGTAASPADAKTWSTARGHFALGMF